MPSTRPRHTTLAVWLPNSTMTSLRTSSLSGTLSRPTDRQPSRSTLRLQKKHRHSSTTNRSTSSSTNSFSNRKSPLYKSTKNYLTNIANLYMKATNSRDNLIKMLNKRKWTTYKPFLKWMIISSNKLWVPKSKTGFWIYMVRISLNVSSNKWT